MACIYQKLNESLSLSYLNITGFYKLPLCPETLIYVKDTQAHPKIYYYQCISLLPGASFVVHAQSLFHPIMH